MRNSLKVFSSGLSRLYGTSYKKGEARKRSELSTVDEAEHRTIPLKETARLLWNFSL